MYTKAAHTALRAFVTHLSWMRQEGKTSINQHKSAVYNGSHTGGGVRAALTMIQQVELNLVGPVPLVPVSFMATLRF